MPNSPTTTSRLDMLESTVRDLRAQSKDTSASISQMTASISTINRNTTDIRESLLELQRFEAKAEAMRSNEKENRERFEKRLNELNLQISKTLARMEDENRLIDERVRKLEYALEVTSAKERAESVKSDRVSKLWIGLIVASFGASLAALFGTFK